jgi:hypothetical protein
MMKRWEQLYVELQRKAERLGYLPPLQLGTANSQTYEFQIGNRPALLVAFRDVGLKRNYSRPDRPWVEGLDLVLDRYAKLAEENPRGPLPPAVAIVIDNIGGAYVVVRLNDLLDLYRHRIRSNLDPKSRKFTFVLIRRQDGYSLQMPHDKSEMPLTIVNSMESVVSLLKSLRDKAPL